MYLIWRTLFKLFFQNWTANTVSCWHWNSFTSFNSVTVFRPAKCHALNTMLIQPTFTSLIPTRLASTSWAFAESSAVAYPLPPGWCIGLCTEGKVSVWYLFQSLVSHHSPFLAVRYMWLQWVGVLILTLMWCADTFYRLQGVFFFFFLLIYMGEKLISVSILDLEFWASRCTCNPQRPFS